MSDEYYLRYRGHSHRVLYNQVMAGDPDQVEDLASSWSRVESALTNISDELNKSLSELGRIWRSTAATEFQQRVRLVTSFARDLASDVGHLRTGLHLMANALREAKNNAEDPAETEDHDKAIAGALLGMPLGPVGSAAGAFIGDKLDEAERQRAHERMVRVVANLAAAYATTVALQWTEASAAPVGLPGDVDTGSPNISSGPYVDRVSAAPQVGTADPAYTRLAAAPDPDAVAKGPVGSTGVDTQYPDGQTTTGDEQGVGGSLLLGAAAAGAVGLAGTIRGAAGVMPSGLSGQGAPSAGGASGASAKGTAGASGVSARGTSMSRLLAAEANPRSALGGVGSTTASSNQSAMLGRGVGVRAGTDLSARAAMLPGTHADDDDDEAERRTWLTEDQMVWTDDKPIAPPVLGESMEG